jgi:hypothetical protein
MGAIRLKKLPKDTKKKFIHFVYGRKGEFG